MNKHYNATVIIFLLMMATLLLFYNFPKREKTVEKKPKQVKQVKPFPPDKRPRIAIVIDDWGYNLDSADYLSEIKAPLTLAILPGLPYSKEIAKMAVSSNKETILHLPLESKANKHAEKGTIYCAMNEKEITEKLKRYLDGAPGICGVNNHQGSKATENKKIMEIILGELKRENLFFLDSRTTNKSVCGQVAKKLGVKYCKKDVFLDLPSPPLKDEKLKIYIRKQLDELCKIAQKKGYAIAIGHDRKDTLEVLKTTLPQLEENGIKIVFVSDLAN